MDYCSIGRGVVHIFALLLGGGILYFIACLIDTCIKNSKIKKELPIEITNFLMDCDFTGFNVGLYLPDNTFKLIRKSMGSGLEVGSIYTKSDSKLYYSSQSLLLDYKGHKIIIFGGTYIQ